MVTSAVSPRLILWLILLNVFINYLKDVTEISFSKFTDNIKIRAVADMLEGLVTIQRDLDRLEKCADCSIMKFCKGKWDGICPCTGTAWELTGEEAA